LPYGDANGHCDADAGEILPVVNIRQYWLGFVGKDPFRSMDGVLKEIKEIDLRSGKISHCRRYSMGFSEEGLKRRGWDMKLEVEMIRKRAS